MITMRSLNSRFQSCSGKRIQPTTRRGELIECGEQLSQVAKIAGPVVATGEQLLQKDVGHGERARDGIAAERSRREQALKQVLLEKVEQNIAHRLRVGR